MKVIAAVLVSAFVFGGAVARTSDLAASPNTSAGASGSAMGQSDAQRDDAVEKHIQKLHGTLKITPSEESQWNSVAATIRENAKDIDRVIDQRAANAASATAVDDLNSYAGIAQTHADGVKKLADAFSVLYSAMPDDQKRLADQTFSHRHGSGNVSK